MPRFPVTLEDAIRRIGDKLVIAPYPLGDGRTTALFIKASPAADKVH